MNPSILHVLENLSREVKVSQINQTISTYAEDIEIVQVANWPNVQGGQATAISGVALLLTSLKTTKRYAKGPIDRLNCIEAEVES